MPTSTQLSSSQQQPPQLTEEIYNSTINLRYTSLQVRAMLQLNKRQEDYLYAHIDDLIVDSGIADMQVQISVKKLMLERIFNNVIAIKQYKALLRGHWWEEPSAQDNCDPCCWDLRTDKPKHWVDKARKLLRNIVNRRADDARKGAGSFETAKRPRNAGQDDEAGRPRKKTKRARKSRGQNEQTRTASPQETLCSPSLGSGSPQKASSSRRMLSSLTRGSWSSQRQVQTPNIIDLEDTLVENGTPNFNLSSPMNHALKSLTNLNEDETVTCVIEFAKKDRRFFHTLKMPLEPSAYLTLLTTMRSKTGTVDGELRLEFDLGDPIGKVDISDNSDLATAILQNADKRFLRLELLVD